MGFLDLPESSRIIGTLSGGQQRRTSLAVSLIHQPELLILDEPTVGVQYIHKDYAIAVCEFTYVKRLILLCENKFGNI